MDPVLSKFHALNLEGAILKRRHITFLLIDWLMLYICILCAGSYAEVSELCMPFKLCAAAVSDVYVYNCV